VSNLHVYSPEPLETHYRVLPKWCRKFHVTKYETWRDAFEDGLRVCGRGFRVFRQTTYEWHEPLNVELIKVSSDSRLLGDHDE